MKKKWLKHLLGILIAIVIIVIISIFFLQETLTFREIENGKCSYSKSIIAVDVDGDGYDELCSLNTYEEGKEEENNYLLVQKNISFGFSQINTGKTKLNNLGKLNIDNDGSEEIYYTMSDGKLISLNFIKYVFTKEGRLRYHLPAEFVRKVGDNNDSGLTIFHIVDLDNDGINELIGSYAPLYEMREIFVLSADSLKLKWSFPSPISIINIIPLDLENDGKKELLILTTPFKNNMFSVQGINDSRVWVYLLNCRGELLFKQNLGGHPGSVNAQILSAKTNEIYLVKNSFLNEANYLAKCKVERDSLKFIKRLDFKEPVRFGILEKYLSDVKNEKYVYLLDNKGILKCYNEELEEIYSYKKNTITDILYPVNDINGDNKPDIVALTLEGKVIFLTWKLKEQGFLPNFQTDNYNDKYILLLHDGKKYKLFTVDMVSDIQHFYSIETRSKLNNIVLIVLVSIFPIIFIYQIRIRAINKQKRILEDAVQKRTEELREKNRSIEDSIRYAKLIQGSLIPGVENLKRYFPDSYNIWLPRDIVGGDFIWFFSEPGSSLKYLSVIDCTGHGVPGAFMSILVMSSLNMVFSQNLHKGLAYCVLELYRRVHSYLAGIDNWQSTDSFVLSITEIDTVQRKLNLICFGQDVLLRNPDLQLIKQKGFKFNTDWEQMEPNFFTVHQIDYMSDTVLYLYSDGIYDQFVNIKHYKNRLGKQGLMDILQNTKNFNEEGEKLRSFLQENIAKYEQRDDISLLAIRL